MKPFNEQRTERTSVSLDQENDSLSVMLAKKRGVAKAVFFRQCIEKELRLAEEMIADLDKIGRR